MSEGRWTARYGRCGLGAALIAACIGMARPAAAEMARDQGRESDAPIEVIADGGAAPLVRGAHLPALASIRLEGGWDSASEEPSGGAVAEVHVWGPVTAIAGAQWVDREGGSLRPTLGGMVQIFAPDEHAFGLAASAVYKPEGFTEPEGEVELTFAAVRRQERLTAVANLAYGQDPEGRERDVEAGLAAATPLAPSAWLGLAARGRASLGTVRERGADWDAAFGPHLTLAVGPCAVVGFAGAIVRGTDIETQTGLATSLGVVQAF